MSAQATGQSFVKDQLVRVINERSPYYQMTGTIHPKPTYHDGKVSVRMSSTWTVIALPVADLRVEEQP